MKKGIILILTLSFLTTLSSNCQIILQPNSGLKSHETLELNKIEISAEKTIVYLTIENRIEGGFFCADKNISLIEPSGNKLKLRKTSGIPSCPDTYKFKAIGEKLHFILEFPPVKPDVKWIDIVEECSSNCFWFYGVTLDNDLNQKLDDAFLLASKGDPGKTATLFRNLLETVDKENPGIKGLLYVNIINAALEAGDKVEAAVWYKRLASSNAPRLSEYIKFLNSRGIKF